ncbi:NAD(P)-binding protein [Actinomadura miaoliensis]|uniref:FAD-dependent oxidoreductase n=1 Tax=Actinomadura miaoliensis TaxID=430685 RepID=A0ABP7UVJ7_9ACTN
MDPDLTIVGAGLTGLTAAIEAAERGWGVVVTEAHSRPGGRARSLAGPYRANAGPHAIYVDGPWWTWLESRGLTPPIVEAPPHSGIVRAGGRLGPWPAELGKAIAALPARAPTEETFRAWLLRHTDAKTAEAIIGVAFIFTFDHDPGRLSAAFTRQGLHRALAGGARYVTGGWSTLVDLLAERAAVQWQQSALRAHCTGAIDPPGTTWHDRPAVNRNGTLSVATDQSAAPGLLAEVGIAAAQLAVQRLAETGKAGKATSEPAARQRPALPR